MSADPSPTFIDLAREAAFRLGGAEVRPSTREIVQGERREVLEPRVMQVLVALARSAGEVVSRGDLIQACWGGRVVGEDAINRCIAAVRRLAQAFGGFDVETIPRVGYRLTEAAAPATARLREIPWRWVAAGLGAVALIVAGVLAFTIGPWRAAPKEPRVAMQPFVVLGGDPQLRVVADRLSDDIAGALSQTNLGATVMKRVADNDILVGATLSQDGAELRVRTYLLDAAGAHTLWSQQFAGTAADVAALRDQINGSLIEATLIAAEPFRQRSLKIDPETLALYIKGRWATAQPDTLHGGEAAAALAAAVARDPDFVAARAMLALADMTAATQQADPTLKGPHLQRARDEALAAIRADSRAAEGAYLALYRFDRARTPTDLIRLEDDILTGVAKVPQSPLLKHQECQLLLEVGRVHDAGLSCQQALALRPMATLLTQDYGHSLYADGDVDLAREQLDKGLRFHPDGRDIRTRRLEIDLYTGPPAAARDRLHDDRLRPQDWQSEHVALAEQFLQARESRSPQGVQAFLDEITQLNAAGRVPVNYVVVSAGALGRPDVAFQALLQSPPERFVRDGFLFEPATASLRHDPRFWQVANRWGLVDYWKKRNVWPDFCADPRLGYDCRAAAAAASSSAKVTPLVSRANSTPTRLTAQANAR
jgi:DNA-binding winged helix-turn-helix (wHTH) protein/TolB-like protein